MPDPAPLKFKVAPHIVQDLGLNLYTSLPRVLVEFVANAYDADSPGVDIKIDIDKIHKARDVTKTEWSARVARKRAAGEPLADDEELETQTLPPGVTIVVEDRGHGMSRGDLGTKFLVVGRRRREEDGKARSPNGRVVMGRKGLGKLAGFGVAHDVIVTSRVKGETNATRITLDYDKLIARRASDEVQVPDESIADAGVLSPSGTRIELSRLVYEPMKSDLATIIGHVADQFYAIDPGDFSIRLNGQPLAPSKRVFVFAYPRPELDVDQLVEDTYTTDEGREVKYSYRIRFTGEGDNLPARERGVRVYAHKRLASAADLLDLSTGIHGFRNTHYMDGVVHADVIDDRQSDYIATDRQSLRWETPFLLPMKTRLTEAMKDACNEYQQFRDEAARKTVKQDGFTRKLIDDAKLPAHRKKLAYRVARMLAVSCEKGIKGKEYKEDMGIFVDGLAQGDILKAIASLAKTNRPDLHAVVGRVISLTQRELDDFIRFVQGRLDGIEALRKICSDVDFASAKNEDDLQRLLSRCPWLIDPTYTQFLTSNQQEATLFDRLEKELRINKHVPAKYDAQVADEVEPGGTNKRPDLTFVLGSKSLSRLVIVELKAPNTPLHNGHLDQLQVYLEDAEQWLAAHGFPGCKVEGRLIGSRASSDSKNEQVKLLRRNIREAGPNSPWRVYDLLELLTESERAHHELVESHEAAVKSLDEDLESD